jgi:hypothetical protein
LAVALTAGVGLAATNGLAAADAVTGDVSVDRCNVRLWSDPDLEGNLTEVGTGFFSTTLVVTERDDGTIAPTENIYEIEIGDSGAETSSFTVTCDISNRSTSTVEVRVAVDNLYEQLSPGAESAGPRCGSGDGSFSNSDIVANDGVGISVFQETIGGCEDNLGRISLRIGIS